MSINAGIKFVHFLYWKASQDPEWLPYAQDVESLVRMLSYDEAEANQGIKL